MSTIRTFYLLSDTAQVDGLDILKIALQACAAQGPVSFNRLSIRAQADMYAAFQAAHEEQGIVVHVLLDDTLRKAAHLFGRTLNVHAIDLLEPMIVHLTDLLEVPRAASPELFMQLDELYFRRIEAIEFAVAHDDGRRAQELDRAEIVLTGVSRTGKTPLSMYMASHGWLVANVPLIVGMEPPASLLQVEPRRVFGLTIRPERLAMLRRVRLSRLGLSAPVNYADPAYVQGDLEHARAVFARNKGWTILDISAKSIEESAHEIITFLSERTDLVPLSPKAGSNLAGSAERI